MFTEIYVASSLKCVQRIAFFNDYYIGCQLTCTLYHCSWKLICGVNEKDGTMFQQGRFLDSLEAFIIKFECYNSETQVPQIMALEQSLLESIYLVP